MSTIYGLYAITDERFSTPALLTAVESILEGGCKLVQYRNKQADYAFRIAEASALLALCQRHGATLLVNDDVDLAITIRAHGVHLGQGDMPIQQARALLGSRAVIGITCHDSLALARAAQDAGADYVAFGRFFPSGTKQSAPPAALSALTAARQQLAVPVVAIGGITLDNAPAVLAAGADALAVVGDLFCSRDIADRSRRYSELFSNRPPKGSH